MKHVLKVTGALALTVAGLAVTGGVAGAAHGHAPSVSGVVTAVDGNATPGTCGTAGEAGSFLLTTTATPAITHTVSVTAATAFAQKSVTSPSFANVCVGYDSTAIGLQSEFELAADAVSIKIPKAVHAFGTVLSVNGVSDAGTCGTAGADGSFTVSTVVDGSPDTVYVLSATKFKEPSVPGATFADLCVGDAANAQGPSVDGTILAQKVIFHAPKIPAPLHVKGFVTSVGGDASTGVCGLSDTAGSYVITWTDRLGETVNSTVEVTATTPFSSKAGVSSFAAVCVGSKSSVIGNTDSSGDLDALAVATYPVKG